jgi:hypothetical protein
VPRRQQQETDGFGFWVACVGAFDVAVVFVGVLAATAAVSVFVVVVLIVVLAAAVRVSL